ncbi:MAG: hypothetical protein IJW99_04630 [Clostridia bacterium]|nr:hypothetical protein [Clostridia bacterium]
MKIERIGLISAGGAVVVASVIVSATVVTDTCEVISLVAVADSVVAPVVIAGVVCSALDTVVVVDASAFSQEVSKTTSNIMAESNIIFFKNIPSLFSSAFLFCTPRGGYSVSSNSA